MLIESFFEKCIVMDKNRIPDGEGGFITTWVESAEIQASIVNDSTMAARVAEKQGVTSTYTITTNKNTILEFHDVIKRVRDGKVFRVTSNGEDKLSPSVASFDIAQVTAEAWELPL